MYSIPSVDHSRPIAKQDEKVFPLFFFEFDKIKVSGSFMRKDVIDLTIRDGVLLPRAWLHHQQMTNDRNGQG